MAAVSVTVLGVGCWRSGTSPSLVSGGSKKCPEMVFELGLEGQTQTCLSNDEKVQFWPKSERKRPRGGWEPNAGVGRNTAGVW